MRVTIITDAGFCPQLEVGGYGYWIASERGKKYGGGRIKVDPIINSIAAEMMGMVNGLYVALRESLVLTGDEVLIQCDCIPALQAFQNMRKNITEQELWVVAKMQEVIKDQNLLVNYRHVKGHTSGNQPRLYVNNFCDEKATKYLSRARAAKNKRKVLEFLNGYNDR